jgi:hypothetical protein
VTEGAAPPDDGGIYAEGCAVMVRPKVSATGCKLGGTIATAQNAETAAEIARRCDAFSDLLAALEWVASGGAKEDTSEMWEAIDRALTRARGNTNGSR